MSKREKIILWITIAVAIMAGIFQLIDSQLLNRPKKQAVNKKAEKNIVNQIKTQNSSDKLQVDVDGSTSLSQRSKDLIKAAAKTWPEDVFFRYQQEREEEIEPQLFVYTGYMQMQGQKYAIINGKPFKKNDKLQGTNWQDYRVKKINPDNVLLVTPQEDTISVPLHKQVPKPLKKKSNQS